MNIERLMTELGNIIGDRHNLKVKTKVSYQQDLFTTRGDFDEEVKWYAKKK